MVTLPMPPAFRGMRRDLVLLHGALGSSAQLQPLADALALNFRVHMLDFEGHGERAHADRPYRMQHFAENVIALLGMADVHRAHVFGYSMGGYVGVHLASVYPERIASVMTLGTKFEWDADTSARECSRLDPNVIRTKVPRFADALAARHAGAGGWESVLERTSELLRDLGAHPLLDAATLANVSVPVRVVVGDLDNTVTVDESTRIAGLLGNGSLTMLQGAPHPIEQVNPAKLVPVIREFFG